jgi:hypothetical protein
VLHLDVTLGGGPAPSTLHLSAFDERRALTLDHQTHAPRIPGTIDLELPDRAAHVRVALRAEPMGLAGVGVTILPHGEVRAALALFPPAADGDGDGIPDSIDNCPQVANAEQADSDGNGVGDSCATPPSGHCVGCVDPGPYNVLFVTSTTYLPGSLGGLAGADAACQARAQAAGLTGAFHAWLSTSTVDARSRFGSARGWVRPDGRPFADSIPQLADTFQIFNPPRIDELGHDLALADPLARVATGSQQDGRRAADTSGDWGSPGSRYAVGNALATGWFWAANDVNPGNTEAHLYCFGVDLSKALAIAPAAGRLAFLSHSFFIPSGGLAAADQLCQSEATTIGRGGSFRALLSTSAAPARSRFDLTGPTWVRLDGVPWLKGAGDLGTPLTSLNLDSTGAYLGFAQAWTGVSDPSQPASDSCSDWMVATGARVGAVGRGEYTNGQQLFDGTRGCDYTQGSVYCLEP